MPAPLERSRGVPRIVVIGGGITGLAAAHRVLELSTSRGVPVDLVLLEARQRLGGTIATERIDAAADSDGAPERAGAPARRDGATRTGYVIEAGPDSFFTAKPWGLDLCQRLGLADHLIGTQPANRRTFIAWRGRLRPLPDSFALLAPMRLGPVLRSSLFSWPGKARMAMDFVLPRRRGEGDESLARFVRRRFGREVLERVAQPLVAGIYTADPETLSLAATMPRFLELERRYGSVIRGLARTRDSGGHRVHEAAALGAAGGSAGEGAVPGDGGRGATSGPRYSLFVAPADGMEALVSALVAHLAGATLRTGARVRSVESEAGAGAGDSAAAAGGSPAGAGSGTGRYRISLEDGATLRADGIIVAAEAHRAARMLNRLDGDVAATLGAIPYASSAAVTLAYRRDQIAHPLDGSGFVVPDAEDINLLACTFSSSKFAGRAPGGTALLRAFFGGALRPAAAEDDDRALVGQAGRELTNLLGITGAPHFVRVHRHPLAMPQYLVGHLERVTAIEAQASRHPGLALAGSGYRGVGIPDCIHSGDQAAERVFTALPAQS